MKSVSVIIPNYNGQALLAANLPLVFELLHSGDEVIVADDVSSDNSVAWLINTYSLAKANNSERAFTVFEGQVILGKKQLIIKVIENQQNLRFAANCNQAVSIAKNEVILLLNSDVRPETTLLKYVLPYFEDDQVFAVGCLEEEDHEGKLVAGGKNELFFARGMFQHRRASDMKTGDTAWVSGGSGMFDKKKWLKLKGFDVAFAPAYWEDVDLSFRARERGWKVLFESQAKVYHNHETTNQSAFGQAAIARMSWKNGQYFTIKNGSWWQKVQFLCWSPYWFWKMKALS